LFSEQDILREFPTTLDLGCNGGNICRALCKDSWNGEVRGSIKDLIQMDTSEEMLQRAKKTAESEEVTKLDCEHLC
jgi:SAM-dependent methyltransferase